MRGAPSRRGGIDDAADSNSHASWPARHFAASLPRFPLAGRRPLVPGLTLPPLPFFILGCIPPRFFACFSRFACGAVQPLRGRTRGCDSADHCERILLPRGAPFQQFEVHGPACAHASAGAGPGASDAAGGPHLRRPAAALWWWSPPPPPSRPPSRHHHCPPARSSPLSQSPSTRRPARSEPRRHGSTRGGQPPPQTRPRSPRAPALPAAAQSAPAPAAVAACVSAGTGRGQGEVLPPTLSPPCESTLACGAQWAMAAPSAPPPPPHLELGAVLGPRGDSLLPHCHLELIQRLLLPRLLPLVEPREVLGPVGGIEGDDRLARAVDRPPPARPLPPAATLAPAANGVG